MALYRATVKRTSLSNGIRLEKGMSVEIASKYSSNPLFVNNGHEVQEAFMRTYGIDLAKHGGGGVKNLGHNLEVVKIG